MRRLASFGLSSGGLAALAAACLGLLGLRALLSGAVHDSFLVWNTALAAVPVLLAHNLAYLERARAGRLARGLCGAAWLLFLPNAPYLATDIVHVRGEDGRMLAFDLFMFGAFGLLGLLAGCASLRLVHDLVERRAGHLAGGLFAVSIAVLTGVGVYLGRVRRWNSWSVLRDPQGLAHDLWSHVTAPAAHPRMLLAVLLVGGAFLLLYGALRHLAGRSRSRSLPE